MISQVIFVGGHVILGVSLLGSVVMEEAGIISVRNLVTILCFALVSFLNYWIWMCPMNRIRNVRMRNQNQSIL